MNINALLLLLTLVSDPATLTLRGRVVCMVEEGNTAAKEHEHQYGFKTTEGKIYPLYRNITSEAFFSDAQMREKTLQITGRIHPEKKTLEVFQTRSVHNGVLHDIYYWCEVCSIRSPAGGPCWCCYKPFELKEVPLPE